MERFWNKVDKSKDCWEWTASKRLGYGIFKINKKSFGAHRLSYEMKNGKIPNGLHVCHKCDNRSCVNPDHLFLGTHSDNMKDSYSKGRLLVPTTSRFRLRHIPANGLISRERAYEIRELIKVKDCSLKELASKIGISYQLIRDINIGRVYK